MGEYENKDREEVYSKKVRAGKRTYFFDVKSTRSGDYYITVTESKKRMEDGVFVKHKIFLYKEDFEKFSDGLMEALGYIREHQPGTVSREQNPGNNDQSSGSGFTNIEFDDLSK